MMVKSNTSMHRQRFSKYIRLGLNIVELYIRPENSSVSTLSKIKKTHIETVCSDKKHNLEIKCELIL